MTVLVSEKMDDFIIPEPNSGCWIWTGVTRTLAAEPPKRILKKVGKRKQHLNLSAVTERACHRSEG